MKGRGAVGLKSTRQCACRIGMTREECMHVIQLSLVQGRGKSGVDRAVCPSFWKRENCAPGLLRLVHGLAWAKCRLLKPSLTEEKAAQATMFRGSQFLRRADRERQPISRAGHTADADKRFVIFPGVSRGFQALEALRALGWRRCGRGDELPYPPK